MNDTEDLKFMKAAVREAEKAHAIGEVPIGCVIVKNGKIIARGYNRRIIDRSTLAHAELAAIRKACKKEGDWRLEECTLYVTLEPCPMCAGAIVQARIPNLVFGCRNAKAGSAGSVLDLMHVSGFNHRVNVTEGVLGEECSRMMSDFFSDLRRTGKCSKDRTAKDSKGGTEKDSKGRTEKDSKGGTAKNSKGRTEKDMINC